MDKRFEGMKFLSAMVFFLALSRPVERSSFERQGSDIATWMLRSCDGLKALGHEVSE
jgi:hypothetical protein